MNDDIVIATRALTLDGHQDGQIEVVLFRPTPDGNDFRCNYTIDGKPGRAYGVDEMQALFLALQSIGSRLYTSAYFKAGKLTWLEMRDLGFPVPPGADDLIPRD
jgi:hypothetical protein